MEKPFSRVETPAPEALAEADEAVLDVISGRVGPSQALVLAREAQAVGQVQGDAGQMQLPRLSLVHGVGKLVETFAVGDLVLDATSPIPILLANKGKPVQCIVLKALDFFREYLNNDQYKAGIKPRSFLNREEVLAAGGTLTWVNNVGPTFAPAIELELLVERPEGVISGLFGIEIGLPGAVKNYAPARWLADKTSYAGVGPAVKAAGFSLRQRGLLAGVFTIQTTIKTENGVTKVRPTLRLTGYNPPEVVAQIQALFAAPVPTA
jgi:hypothetical protein